MRFLAHISRAKWQTAWLVLLYLVLVALVASTLGGLITLGFSLGSKNSNVELNMTVFLSSALVIGLLMIIVAFIEAWQSSQQGGMYVMQQLKGRSIYRAESPLEIRLNHVVDEVVIAAGSGCPHPLVYVLEAETSINAVTAGSFGSNLAIGVTLGALTLLNREQLQGLVAHELGHMLEEDTVVNQRLSAMTFSLRQLQLASEELFAIESGKVWFFACLCWLVGCAGALAGRVLQSAVSRKREYLADAHAVRLTRNPQALIGVLQKIAVQNRIEPDEAVFFNPRARAIGHSFFDSVYAHQD